MLYFLVPFEAKVFFKEKTLALTSVWEFIQGHSASRKERCKRNSQLPRWERGKNFNGY